jgi:hypothetical protein
LLSWPKTDMSPIFPPWASMNFSLWTNIPPEPQQGSKILPLVWLKHLDQEPDDGSGSIELSSFLAFYICKLT